MIRRANILITLLALTVFISIAGREGSCQNLAFPIDPEGMKVMDRVCDRFFINNKPVVVYAIMYNRGKCTCVDVFKGTEGPRTMIWKKVYTWKPATEGSSPACFPFPSLLKSYIEEPAISFSIVNDMKYHDGQVNFHLTYDVTKGTFKESWSD